MTGWWILGRGPAELVIEIPRTGVSALPKIQHALEKFGANSQESEGHIVSTALPARKVLGWEYGEKQIIPCTFRPAPRQSQPSSVVATCDVSVVRGRKRPFGYVWSVATVVIGVIVATTGRGVTTEGLVAFLVALLGPWVILQFIFFLDCLRVRTKVLWLMRSVG
jgi:hypothetical protein